MSVIPFDTFSVMLSFILFQNTIFQNKIKMYFLKKNTTKKYET